MQNLTVGRSHDESASSVGTLKLWQLLGAPLKAIPHPVAIIAKDITANIPFDYVHTVSTSTRGAATTAGSCRIKSTWT